MANKHEPDEYNRNRRSKSIKLALAFAAVAVLWYVVAMVVIWTQ
jgi:hypothetical protein